MISSQRFVCWVFRQMGRMFMLSYHRIPFKWIVRCGPSGGLPHLEQTILAAPAVAGHHDFDLPSRSCGGPYYYDYLAACQWRLADS